LPKLHETTLRFDDGTSILAYALRKWPSSSDRPVVAFLHGSLRNSRALEDWPARIDPVADGVLFDLPGHGKSDPIAVPSVGGLAGRVLGGLRAAFPDRHVLLVGESLGGTLALAIGSVTEQNPVKAVFAADPPMTTAKLWNVAITHRLAMAKQEPDSFVHRLSDLVFGLKPNAVEERIYYQLLGSLRVPAVIATGDVPLLPQRAKQLDTSIFDSVDQFVAKKLYPDKAQIERVPNCGHLMLIDAVQPCEAMIQRMLATHFAFPTPVP